MNLRHREGERKMSEYSIGAGLEAVDALEKFSKAGFPLKFIEKLSEKTIAIDNRTTSLMQQWSSSQVDEETKKTLMNEVQELQFTFKELNKVADAVYDLFEKYPSDMTKPIENAWAILIECLWGKAKKEMAPFVLGIRVGTVFTLKYGNPWENMEGEKEK